MKEGKQERNPQFSTGSPLWRIPLPHPHAMALADFSTCAFIPRATRNSKLSSRLSLTLLSSAPRPHVAVCHNYQHPLGKRLFLEVISHSDTTGSQQKLELLQISAKRPMCWKLSDHQKYMLSRKYSSIQGRKGKCHEKTRCPFFPSNPAMQKGGRLGSQTTNISSHCESPISFI